MRLISNEPVYDLYTKVTNFKCPGGVHIWSSLRLPLYVFVIDNRLLPMGAWGQI